MKYRIAYINLEGVKKEIDIDGVESEEEAKEEIEPEVKQFIDVREL